MGGWAGVRGGEVCGRTGRGRRCGADVGAGYEVIGCARCAHCRAHPVPTPRARQVCHAFSVDLYAPPEVGEVFDNLDDELFPPPPPPPLVQRCPSSELFIGTDAHFRQQHGVQLRVRYPLDGVVPPSVALADGAPVHFEQAVPGDLLRLLPTCELGCGTDADSTAGQHFPFQAPPPPPPPPTPNPNPNPHPHPSPYPNPCPDPTRTRTPPLPATLHQVRQRVHRGTQDDPRPRLRQPVQPLLQPLPLRDHRLPRALHLRG